MGEDVWISKHPGKSWKLKSSCNSLQNRLFLPLKTHKEEIMHQVQPNPFKAFVSTRFIYFSPEQASSDSNGSLEACLLDDNKWWTIYLVKSQWKIRMEGYFYKHLFNKDMYRNLKAKKVDGKQLWYTLGHLSTSISNWWELEKK